jgi:hypothetical protein
MYEDDDEVEGWGCKCAFDGDDDGGNAGPRVAPTAAPAFERE